MIYDVGDQVTLTSLLSINDGPATLVVTDPAGVPTTTTGVSFISNAYTATFTVTLPGRHVVRWTTAHNVTQDVFEAQDVLIGIVSVADARRWLRLRDSDTDDNDKIQSLIETATDLIQDVTGPILTTTYTEQYDGGGTTITVMHRPVVSITLVMEYWGNFGRIITEQPLGAQTSPFGYTLDLPLGQITRRTFGGDSSRFATGQKNVIITYVAARLPVPASIQMACRELVKHLYVNTQVPVGKARVNAAEQDMAAPVSYAIPNFVLDMIPLKYRRPPGVA